MAAHPPATAGGTDLIQLHGGPTRYRAGGTDDLIQLHDRVDVFSVDSRLNIGPNNSATIEMQRQLSQALTLPFGQPYLFGICSCRLTGCTTEIPEPATIALLVSCLASMADFVKKRRALR